MFGLGIGEIILIVLITFLVAPKDIPKIIKKVAIFLRDLNKIKENISEISEDIEDIVKKEIEKIDNENEKDNYK